jgi:ADP-ribose pyrophosphatase YjhB (NUDIX family)
MKVDFPLPADDRQHIYCISCHFDGVREVFKDGQKFFECPHCGQTSDRGIYLRNNAAAKWWLGNDRELWHESAGVFIRRPDGKYLFFERTDFPKGYTIPAGHVDFGEDGAVAARRETQEETGIKTTHLILVGEVDIVGDSCIGGADVHHWHVFREDLASPIEITEVEEGQRPVWLTLQEVKNRPKPFAIDHLLKHFGDQIEAPDKSLQK